MPSGDRAGGARPPLSQTVGLDESEHFRPIGREQHHHEARAGAKAGVRLQAGRAELEVGGRHDVEKPVIETEANSRPILGGAARESCEAPLDRLDGVGRRQQRLYIGLTEVEGHRLDTLGMPDRLMVPLAALEPDGRTLVEHDGHEIAVFRVEERVYAVANACPHEGNPLIEGDVLGGNLTCAYHAWTFDLATGSCLVGDEAARTYPVEVQDDVICISIPS